jgi:hypothetical protein
MGSSSAPFEMAYDKVKVKFEEIMWHVRCGLVCILVAMFGRYGII